MKTKPDATDRAQAIQRGKRLAAERERLRLTQDEMAEICGLHKNTQWNYENGLSEPDARYLATVMRLGVDVHYVFTGSGSQVRDQSQAADQLAALARLWVRLPSASVAKVIAYGEALLP